MKKPSISACDPVEGELAELRRAAKSALKLAKQTGTGCYVIENGKIVDIARSKDSRKRASK
jgi:hypothetical protein